MQPGETIEPSQQPAHNLLNQGATHPQPAVSSQQMASKQIGQQDGVSWEGSEYVEHEKPAGWYVILVGVALLVAVLVYLVSKDLVTTVVIAIAAVLFGVMAARKPKVLPYLIGSKGITIGQRHYMYAEFKTFSVVDETAIHSVVLLPLRRFMPPLSLYYPPELEDQIVETLGTYLPYAEGSGDAFDRFMTRIRF